MPEGQILEAIVLYIEGERIHHIYPEDSPTFHLGWDPDLIPGEVVIDEVAMLGLSPFLVHSTSWRLHEGHIVLTFVVCVEAPDRSHALMRDEIVDRSELARGHAMGPPLEVEAHHVVEHGLRHLAWLVHDDSAFREALPEWVKALADYKPEPFRAFGGRPRR